MISREQIPSVLGHTAYDRDHHKLGRIGQVFIDDETGTPEWMTVQTGMFGGKETFVPLVPAELQGEEVLLPFEEDQIKHAPKVETEAGHLTPSEEARLYEHYGMQYQPYAAEEPQARQAEGAPGTAEEERAAPAEGGPVKRVRRTETYTEEETLGGEGQRQHREGGAEERPEGEWR